MSTANILDLIPHRYPFILVDKIVELELKKRAVGTKNLTHNEPFFQGHFPDHPVMPGSLVLEGLVQTATALLLQDIEFSGRYPSFSAIKQVDFREDAHPGDVIRFEVQLISLKERSIELEGVALVDGKVICEGMLTFSLSAKPSKSRIHPTASVHPSAVLGKDVVVGPFAIIGENVLIGDRTVIEAHVMVEKWTRIGDDCRIHFGCVLGSEAQDVKYEGEKTWVVIGDRNEIREYVTINRSTGKDTVTTIGSDNIFLTHVHIGHNCEIGSHVIVANSTNIAGHCVVEDYATIGGMTGFHQFVRIGRGAMVGAYTRLPQDVPPFMLCEGNPAVIRTINVIGMKRRGANREAVSEVKSIYKLLYRSEKNMRQALDEIAEMSVATDEAQHLISFLKVDSDRGITKKSSNGSSSDD